MAIACTYPEWEKIRFYFTHTKKHNRRISCSHSLGFQQHRRRPFPFLSLQYFYRQPTTNSPPPVDGTIKEYINPQVLRNTQLTTTTLPPKSNLLDFWVNKREDEIAGPCVNPFFVEGTRILKDEDDGSYSNKDRKKRRNSRAAIKLFRLAKLTFSVVVGSVLSTAAALIPPPSIHPRSNVIPSASHLLLLLLLDRVFISI